VLHAEQGDPHAARAGYIAAVDIYTELDAA
jgi:hypothetical protein